MGEQNVVHTDSGVSFSLQMEGNSDTCLNLDESWRYCTEGCEPDKKGFHSQETPGVVKIIETGSQMVVSGGGQMES